MAMYRITAGDLVTMVEGDDLDTALLTFHDATPADDDVRLDWISTDSPVDCVGVFWTKTGTVLMQGPAHFRLGELLTAREVKG